MRNSLYDRTAARNACTIEIVIGNISRAPTLVVAVMRGLNDAVIPLLFKEELTDVRQSTRVRVKSS